MEEMAGTIHEYERQNRDLADKEHRSKGLSSSLQEENTRTSAAIKKCQQQIVRLESLVEQLKLDILSKQEKLPSDSEN